MDYVAQIRQKKKENAKEKLRAGEQKSCSGIPDTFSGFIQDKASGIF